MFIFLHLCLPSSLMLVKWDDHKTIDHHLMLDLCLTDWSPYKELKKMTSTVITNNK
jgi:hypothetical protein